VTSGSRSALTRIVFAIALLLAAGAGGFLAYRVIGLHPSTITAVPVSKEGSLPESPPAGEGSQPGTEPAAAPPTHAIPERLPDIALADRDGVRRKLSDWKGRPLMVNFWATWCEPCRREIPLLKSLRRQRSADALEIVGIAVDFRDAVIKYAREIGIDYPVLIGEQDGLDAIAAFGMDTVFPFTVFADRQGRIVTLKVGELHADEAHFILDRVKGIDSGRMDLAMAKKEIADGVAGLAAKRAQQEEAQEATQASAVKSPSVLRK